MNDDAMNKVMAVAGLAVAAVVAWMSVDLLRTRAAEPEETPADGG